jgi:DNA-binding NtrC family response regulator
MNAPRRILLVDDDPNVLEISLEVLAMSGFEIVTATDGEQALARLHAGERFAALVTDHSMPGLSGLDLVRQARALDPGMHCLLVTGYGDTVEGGIEVTFLRKPFRVVELAAAVEALFT